MELMDWKNVERTSESQIADCKVQIIIAEILLKEAIKEIKQLGGLTNDEEVKKANKDPK